MKRTWTVLLTAVMVLGCIVVVLESTTARPLASECRVYGQATYFGSPAPVGLRLEARVENQVIADTAITITGRFTLVIPPDDLQTTKKDGWQSEDQITIWVDGHEARPIFAPFEGSKEINLTVSSIALDVKRSTWGKIKALFR
jgi:hypothetical protein